tara:strand:- start:69 stop:338 length:270 start_codon:yes stop_codon:yes gene_type:complete
MFDNKTISYILFIIAFILLIYTKKQTQVNDIPDITIKYNEIFFLLSSLYAIRWLATDNYQRGVFYIVFSLLNVYIAHLHFYEHNLISNI